MEPYMATKSVNPSPEISDSFWKLKISETACEHCHNLELYYLTIEFAVLQEGATSGCPACQLLNQSINAFVSTGDEIVAIEVLVECAMYVSLFAKGNQYLKTIELYTDIGKPCIWPKIGPGRAVSTDPSSAQCIELAQGWLENCLEKHPLCRPLESTPLPTRVIDVGTSNSGVHLVVTKRENANYAALSHCWGTFRVPIATTAETLGDRTKSIRFDSGSKTFADAVNVTRQLGIKYLWIDSLCIIQKDSDDWATEAGKMSEIFRNAIIVFSADAAEDASQGLFTPTTTRILKHESRSARVPGRTGESTVYFRLRASNPTDPKAPPHSSHPRHDTQLSTRAWVVQERLLATRMLHFYQEEMVWSCSSLARCECRYQPTISSSGALRGIINKVSSQPSIELMSEWSRIVSTFTSKKLTMTTDRLPAIAGLAGLVQQALSPRYHCGLWRHDMAYQLLWISVPDPNAQITRCTPEAHAPSWSWASITGPVYYLDRHRTRFESGSGGAEVKPLLDVVFVSTRPKGPNPYGPSEGGSLIVRGQLLPVYLIIEPSRCVWRPLIRELFDENPNVEPYVYSDVREEGLHAVPDDHGTYSVLFPVGDYFFLRAAIYISGGVWSTASRENVCLLLRRRDDMPGKVEIFSRAGIAMFGFSTDKVWESGVAPEREVIIV